MAKAKQAKQRRDRKLCVFAKPPEIGQVKTRLFPALKPSDAAWLYLAFLNDITQELLDGPYRLSFAWAIPGGSDLPKHGGVESEEQAGEDLGERLYNAFAAGLEEAETMVIVGSDQPELEKSRAVEAFGLLEQGSEVVLGPSADGGYYLIGLRRGALARGLFEGIAWSTGTVFAQTLERCQKAGLSAALLPVGFDIDTPADLDALAQRLKQASKDRCRFTRVLFEEWGRL
jgi:rSAM/selenodomain-associated transferase 1